MEVDVAVMSPASNSIIHFIDVLCIFFTQVKSTERHMDKILKPIFVVESSHPYTYELKEPVEITCKGAESFKVTYGSQSKFPPMEFMKGIRIVNPHNKLDAHRYSSDSNTAGNTVIVDSKDHIVIEFDYADIRKQKLEYLVGHPVPDCYGFKLKIVPKFESEILTLNDFLDQILRSSTWLIGRFAYSLIKMKKTEKETDEEKNYKLLLHSKIFSGGFENRFLHIFSKRTIKRLQELTEITEDKALLSFFTEKAANDKLIDTNANLTPEDQCLFSILREKSEAKTDAFLMLLQKMFAKSVMWGNVGGMTGERMVRAAFAPIIKFSGLTVDFMQLVEEYSIEEEMHADIEDKKEREHKIVLQLKTNPKFDLVSKRWAVASRMRTFYQEIKKSISEAIEKKKAKLLLVRGGGGQSSQQEEEFT